MEIKQKLKAFANRVGRGDQSPAAALLRIEKRLAAIEKRLDAIGQDVGRRGALTHFHHLHHALDSVVRRLYVDAQALDYPHRLISQRFRLHSQNYEDGITKAIFDLAGPTDRRAVEIGCGSNGGNSGFLVKELGWRGLLVDSSAAKLKKLSATVSPSHATLVESWITTENINSLLQQHGFTGDIDFMSIDVDGIDYWLWECLQAAQPRLLVIEYNPAFGAVPSVVVPYQPDFSRRETGDRLYYGASLRAMVRLGERKGYRLAAAEPRGVNAFFLRNDVAPEIPTCSVEEGYRLLDKYVEVVADDQVAKFRREGRTLLDV